ncbi:MAG: hypothetical protein IPK62_14980 [Bacteroidetes bacterium]|nr:hypothetical protein [Bacteroidota bacterium]
MLKNKATKGDLIICLPKLIDKVLHFQNSGATIIEYSNFDYTPVSRFTITNFGREDAKIAVGKSLENNIHMIEEYKTEHPFFHVASDLVNLLRKKIKQNERRKTKNNRRL